MEIDRKAFGQRLREARRAKGMTQLAASEAANLALDYYGRLERGVNSPSIATLLVLCDELDVSADVLLGLEPRRRPGRGE